jgi:hypothetical protein
MDPGIRRTTTRKAFTPLVLADGNAGGRLVFEQDEPGGRHILLQEPEADAIAGVVEKPALAVVGVGAAGEHQTSLRRRFTSERVDEPRLADPPLAADQQCATAPLERLAAARGACRARSAPDGAYGQSALSCGVPELGHDV